jgi:prevent-host-death family protein
MADDDIFSTYDAKARFSELLRRVREGRTVTVTYQGEPVAEVRPLGRPTGTAARLEWLRSRGVVVGPGDQTAGLESITQRPGALERFLADRNE